MAPKKTKQTKKTIQSLPYLPPISSFSKTKFHAELNLDISQKKINSFIHHFMIFMERADSSDFSLSPFHFLEKTVQLHKEFFAEVLNTLLLQKLPNVRHLYFIGLLYETVFKDFLLAEEYYFKAIDMKYPPAFLTIGYWFDLGIGHYKSDMNLAIKYYQDSAKYNYPLAFFNLALCYSQGLGIKKNVKLALEYFNKAIKLQYPIAMDNLGVAYLNGEDEVEKDVKKAIDLFSRAIKMGDELAMFYLGTVYENGIYYEIEPNLQFAFQCYSESAELGSSDSIYRMFYCYAHGIGVKRNIHKSIPFLQQAMELNVPHSNFHYGLLLLDGIFVQKNEKEAFHQFQQCLSLQSPECYFWTGYCFIEGIGTNSSFLDGLELMNQNDEYGLNTFPLVYSSSLLPRKRCYQ